MQANLKAIHAWCLIPLYKKYRIALAFSRLWLHRIQMYLSHTSFRRSAFRWWHLHLIHFALNHIWAQFYWVSIHTALRVQYKSMLCLYTCSIQQQKVLLYAANNRTAQDMICNKLYMLRVRESIIHILPANEWRKTSLPQNYLRKLPRGCYICSILQLHVKNICELYTNFPYSLISSVDFLVFMVTDFHSTHFATNSNTYLKYNLKAYTTMDTFNYVQHSVLSPTMSCTILFPTRIKFRWSQWKKARSQNT